MKRERDLLSDLMGSLNIRNKRRKEIICIQSHDDIFNIGKIELENRLYTKDEIIMLINARENTLFSKFKKFFFSFLPKGSTNSIIPNWIK